MPNPTEEFAKKIRSGENPYIKIARYVKSELKQLALLVESNEAGGKEFYCTLGVRRIKKSLEGDGTLKEGDASAWFIGRTIKATLDCLGLEQGKDYVAKEGSDCGSRYILEINKSNIKKLRKDGIGI